MGKCPFIAIQRITREVTRDATGKVIEEKEIPGLELRDCLRQDCELFDAAAAKCSLPTIDNKLNRVEEASAKAQDIGSEIKETRENVAATLLHVLRKADTSNDLLNQVNEALKKAPRPEGGAPETLQQPLNEIKEALNLSQAKFGDILELMLEDQQKRAAGGDQLAEIKAILSAGQGKLQELIDKASAQSPGADLGIVVKEGMGGLGSELAEVKELLKNSQTKFGDILELMLEDQQKKAADSMQLSDLLTELTKKQELLAGSIAENLQGAVQAMAAQKPSGLELPGVVDRLESTLQKFTEAETKRQAELETVGTKMADVQQNILNLLEVQRNEQRATGNERRRREADEHNERGVMFFHRRELTAAEREFQLALEIRPEFAEVYNNLGLVLSDQGKREEAIKAFKKAVELSPDAPEAYNNLGCLFKVKKDFQQAVELFNQAIAKREDYSLAYFNLGLAYEETEKFDLAIKAWEKVLALQPTHEEARRKLATYRARRG